MSGLLQFVRMPDFILEDLHGRPVSQRNILAYMHNSLIASAPLYLQTFWTTVSSLLGHYSSQWVIRYVSAAVDTFSAQLQLRVVTWNPKEMFESEKWTATCSEFKTKY